MWLRVHVSEHRDYGRKLTSELVMALWEEIAEAKVLIAPGTMVRSFRRFYALANPSRSSLAVPLATKRRRKS